MNKHILTIAFALLILSGCNRDTRDTSSVAGPAQARDLITPVARTSASADSSIPFRTTADFQRTPAAGVDEARSRRVLPPPEPTTPDGRIVTGQPEPVEPPRGSMGRDGRASALPRIERDRIAQNSGPENPLDIGPSPLPPGVENFPGMTPSGTAKTAGQLQPTGRQPATVRLSQEPAEVAAPTIAVPATTTPAVESPRRKSEIRGWLSEHQ